MKTIILLASLLSVTQVSAVYLSSCQNFSPTPSTAVSYSYQSCINNNFRTIERAMENSVYLQSCYNYGGTVDFSFTNCIQNNFREVERKLDRSIFLNYCGNFRRDTLDYSFVSCVNNNYRTVERELNLK